MTHEQFQGVVELVSHEPGTNNAFLEFLQTLIALKLKDKGSQHQVLTVSCESLL